MNTVEETCVGVEPGQCNVTEAQEITFHLLTPPEEFDNPFIEASSFPSILSARVNDSN